MQVTQNTPLIEWGVASRKFPGANDSGDQYVVEPFQPRGPSKPDGVLVGVVDGLGHGPKAAIAAKEAVAVLQEHAHEPLVWLFERSHKRLRKTRGVVMSLASFNARGRIMTWMGVGNVEGLYLRGSAPARAKPDRLLLRGGIVGYRLPSLRPAVIPVTQGDTLIFATDGLRSGFVDAATTRGSPQQIADHIFDQFYRGTDDAMILVARYIGTKDT
jgi:negative regulator of sigma-B (phosphoserine phosphatase)